jgi:hypothetical protein
MRLAAILLGQDADTNVAPMHHQGWMIIIAALAFLALILAATNFFMGVH